MNNSKFFYISFAVIFILFLVSFAFNIYYLITDKQQSTDSQTVITTRVDTIRDTIPTIKWEKEIYYITDTFRVKAIIHDTINNEVKSVVDIPINQKVYSDDSTYTAYVSGYRQELDSINVYRKETFIDRQVTITKKDNKHFGFGPAIWGGYGFQNKKLEWGVGFSVTYNILKF